MKEWKLVYRVSYTDGVMWDLEEWFNAESKEDAEKLSEEFMQKERDPLNGVSRVSKLYLFEKP